MSLALPAALFVATEGAAGADRMHTEPAGRPPVIPRVDTHTAEGRVIEVRRMSQELTMRTSHGTIEHVMVPPALHGPHGNPALSEIRAGMLVHAEGELDSRERLIARSISAH